MAAVLYLFPTEFEAAPFRVLRPQAEVRIVGVGMSQAAATLSRIIAEEQPERVVLCGIAGACDERLDVGTAVEVVADYEQGLPARYAEQYEPMRFTPLPKVKAATVSRCGESLSEGDVNEAGALPVVEQMEGAAIGAVCRAWGVEYSHLRTISNRVGDARPLWRADEAVEHLAKVLSELHDVLTGRN